MQHGQVFVFGLLTVVAAAIWYDERVEQTRAAPPPPQAVAGVATR